MPHSTARIGSNGDCYYFMHSDVPVNFEDGDDEQKQVKTFFTALLIRMLTSRHADAAQVLMNEEVLERLRTFSLLRSF